MKIPPSEAWELDFVEISNLSELNSGHNIDTSIMLNYERQQNGME